ncbi:MAG: toll/interleukin-1 receptor domain-containing protein [bacterium]|nr:toll/interleukin-1 receptor domain-containing protein [bacterium]
MKKVFLSHSSRDKAFARKLASELQANGVQVWIDEAEIRVGDSLIKKISLAIDDADFIAVVLSNESVNSEWVMSELKMAMTKELSDCKVRILPILKEKCEIPLFLRDKLYADFTNPENFDVPLEQLFRVLDISKPTAYSKQPPTSLGLVVSHEEARGAVAPADIHSFGEPVMTLEGFDDVRIIDRDKNKTYKPDDAKALYNVYLKLSQYPPSEWVEYFDAERQFPRHTMWRRAWIEGNCVVVHCVPDEIAKYHLKDLKQDVQNANAQYREYLKKVAQQEAKHNHLEREEQRSLDRALDDLKF